MTSYVVLKRSDGDGWMPGNVLIDPNRADILVQRGFIREVSDDYAEKLAAAAQAAADQPMSFQAALDAGYSVRAATALAKGNNPKYVQEETAKLSERDAFRATRPEAEALSKAMEVHIDEVYGLSDEDYAKGVEAFLKEAEPEAVEEGEPEPTEPEPEATPAATPE